MKVAWIADLGRVWLENRVESGIRGDGEFSAWIVGGRVWLAGFGETKLRTWK
jgi:hypothetical protein